MIWSFWEHYGSLVFPAIFYLLAFANFLKIINRNINPPTALAWILVNFLMPYVGVPLYYLIGENRLRSYVRLREKRQIRDPSIKVDTLGLKGPKATELNAHNNSLFGSLGHLYDRCSGQINLLVDGPETFQAIFEAISKAEHYILVQYYILRSDRLGIELKDLLVRKARDGIAIYLLYDDIGSFWLTQTYVRDLRRAGVRVARFLPFRFFTNMHANFRNHRKLVLVDGQVAFTGGLNVGDEYIGRRKEGYWRDSHLKITGEPVLRLQRVFQDDWYFAAKGQIKHLLHQLPVSATDERVQLAPSPSTCEVQVIPFGPNDKIFIGLLLFMEAILSAKKRIWLATPYFIPDTTLERLLELALLRGVDVRLILPAVPDHRVVHWVSLSYARQLRDKGLKVYLYHKGFMHQKFILVDDSITVAGTSNFDNRTIYLNFETALVVNDREFNERVALMLLRDMADAHSLESSEILRGFALFRTRIARLLAPLL